MTRPGMHRGILHVCYCLATAGIGQSEKVKINLCSWEEEGRKKTDLEVGGYLEAGGGGGGVWYLK